MNIFYSWQSDTPSNIGKAFIREALDLALKKIEASMDLDEAERPFIDQDTQGVMGSPGIADTIFEKIRSSGVIVTDVTLVGKVDQGKKLINSNVGIELGFAYGCHGDHVTLSVMNTHYGSAENLPFDLRFRRWPVRFELSPDADKSSRKKVREELAKEFAVILKQYFTKNEQTLSKTYAPTRSTKNPAMYWEEMEYVIDETISAKMHTNPSQFGYTIDQPLIYMRIWPDAPLEELTGAELNKLRSKGIYPLMERGYDSWYGRNRYGVIGYSCNDVGYLEATTQIFKNREIWGVEAYLLATDSRPDNHDIDYVPTGAVKQGIAQSLKTYLKIATALGYPESVHVEFGMVNVNGFRLALSSNFRDKYSDTIFENILLKTTINQGGSNRIDMAVSQILNKVYDAAGMESPQN